MGYCCKDFLRTFLTIFNIIVILFGITTVVISIYVAVNFGDEFQELDIQQPIAASMAFGFGLIVFAIVGLIGMNNENQSCGIIYIVGLFIMGIGILVVGGLLSNLSDDADATRDSVSDNKNQERMIDFELATFTECCGNFVVNLQVQECGIVGVPPCFSDADRFEGFQEAIGDDFCDFLRDVEIDDHPLVGGVADRGCGGGLAFVFVNDMGQFLETAIERLAIANIVAGVVILFLLFCSCYLLWTDEEEKKKKKRGCL